MQDLNTKVILPNADSYSLVVTDCDRCGDGKLCLTNLNFPPCCEYCLSISDQDEIESNLIAKYFEFD